MEIPEEIDSVTKGVQAFASTMKPISGASGSAKELMVEDEESYMNPTESYFSYI